MFRWFRQGPPERDTALAMVDPRPADAVLFLGAERPALAGRAAAIAGLNGRAVVIGHGPEADRAVAKAAADAGALVEFLDAPIAALPFEDNTFNLVIAPAFAAWPADARPATLTEALRVMRPGGRIILITGEERGRFFGRLSAPAPAIPADVVIDSLKARGAVSVRRVAEVKGVAYYEARKAR